MAHKSKQAEELTRLGVLLFIGMDGMDDAGDGLRMDEARDLDEVHRRLMADSAYRDTLHEAAHHVGLRDDVIPEVVAFIDGDLTQPDYDPYQYCADCYDDWGDYHRPHED